MVAPARRAAWHILRSVHHQGADLSSALEVVRKSLPDSRDRALVSELVHGVLRWRLALDHVIAWAGHRDASAFDAPVLDILRLGAYQILHLTRVPISAAVDDGVNLCREVGAPRAAGTVNAVLRQISRHRETLPLPDERDEQGYLSTTLSHPPWLAQRWLQRMGFDRAHAWAVFNNTPAPLVIRAHTWRESRESLAAWLAAQGVETRPTRFAPDGLVVVSGNPITDAGGAGVRFTVQDESSQLVAAFLAAGRGERVLDACAAPGGKTTAIAATTGPEGLTVASDLRPRRVRLLARLLAASGAPGVAIVRADATAALPYRAVFDAVLLDAPCSGLATIRRDPDIRWRRVESDLAGLAEIQVRMLHRAAAIVVPAAGLVYATCSSEPEENEAVIERFCAEVDGWQVEAPAARAAALGADVLACLDASGFLKPSPDVHGLEPFFAACLRRTG